MLVCLCFFIYWIYWLFTQQTKTTEKNFFLELDEEEFDEEFDDEETYWDDLGAYEDELDEDTMYELP